jgi:hypothetical protein
MTMGKFISNFFLGVLAVGLSIFTASRTLDLLTWALPAGQQIYTWLGLAAFEGGMYFWAFFFISGAKGTPQRSISIIMAVFSVIAVCVATVADLTLGASESGKLPALPPSMQQTMIVFVGVVIALNVAAFLACHLMSPEKLREIKSGQAEDLIYHEGLRAIEALAPSIAADAAPHLAADWSNQVWKRIVPGVPRRTEYLPAPAAAPALPAPAPALPVQTLPASAPASAAPVVSSQPPAKSGLLSKAKGFLGRGTGKPEAAAFEQTGTIQASEKTSNQLYREEMRARRAAAPASQVAAMRRARRAARFHQAPATAAAPAPEQEAAASLVEKRTCSECPTVFEVQRNAKKLTCSDACRAKRARRLATERQARKG